MYKLLLLFGVFLPSMTIYCQVIENFSDGDFSQNPEWYGDTSDFKISTSSAIPPEMKPALQLDMESTDSSYMVVLNQLMEETEWNCWIKLSFNTSANNFGKIYLVSNEANLHGSLQGYYLQIGGSNDSIRFFRQDGLTSNLLMQGSHTFTGNSTNMIRIRITHTAMGHWKVFCDPEGGTAFQLEGEVTDDTYLSTQYFGFCCKYTSSNSTKFYFDDIEIKAVDTLPPVLESVIPQSSNSILLTFNEVLLAESVVNPSHYLLEPPAGNLTEAVLEEDLKSVSLKWSQVLTNGQPYNINIFNISDINGNTLMETSKEFIFEEPYFADPYDLIINELMIDPSPGVGLPEYEYLEIFNQTPHTIYLKNWKLLIGESEKTIPNTHISPEGYLILTSEEGAPIFGLFGESVPIAGFSLNNSAQTIGLVSENNTFIHIISYSNEWYHDPEKEDGGYSIEMINPAAVCVCEENWDASVELIGGTPGTINSVYEPTEYDAEVTKIIMPEANQLEIEFNQNIQLSSLNTPANFLVDQNIGNPSNIIIDTLFASRLIMDFNQHFESSTLYHLEFPNDLLDCVGDRVSIQSIAFGLPEKAEKGEVVINEILFNPRNDGVDFVEIFNNSDKFIDLNSLFLGSVEYNSWDPNDTIFKSVSSEKTMLFPHAYLLLTKNTTKVLEQYDTENPSAFYEMNSFPVYNNDEGSVILRSWYTNIDIAYYTESYHHPLLTSLDGVSLEKIHPDLSSLDMKSWHSAAETVGFATPGYQNSQYIESNEIVDPLYLSPEIFSPDMDGYNDVLSIQYYLEEPGYMANVYIFDAHGRLIRQLVNNDMLGTQGTFTWDGTTDDQTKAPIGIYVIYAELFHPAGMVNRIKKTTVLGGKL